MGKVLFDSLSWTGLDPRDYIDDYLECTGKTREDYPGLQPTNLGVFYHRGYEDLLQDVLDWLQENSLQNWEDFLEQCKGETSNRCLVTGYFMSWMGPQAGGKIYKNLETAVQSILMDGDSHPIFSINDEGNLVLDETHHDAPCSGNHYEFRILTAKGETYYNNHCNDDRRTLHENLKLRGRTRNVNIKIFGFNSIKEVK